MCLLVLILTMGDYIQSTPGYWIIFKYRNVLFTVLSQVS